MIGAIRGATGAGIRKIRKVVGWSIVDHMRARLVPLPLTTPMATTTRAANTPRLATEPRSNTSTNSSPLTNTQVVQ